MQYRYYLGLQLPQQLNDRIIQVQKQFFDDRTMRQPLEPHITLLPPPAVERIEPEELVRQATATAQSFWPLRLSLAAIQTYGDHTIVATVEGQQVYDLQKQLQSLLPPDVEVLYYPHPKFSPHVTLVQAKRGKSLPPGLAKLYAEKLASLLPIAFEAKQLVLYKWLAPRIYKAQPL